MRPCYLAVDIGASSGRHILGFVQDGRIELKEIYRFENGLIHKNGHLCWDIDKLFQETVNGLKACRAAGYEPVTMGIDTWAVDFVLLDAEGSRIGDAVAYRDARTDGVREALEQSGTLRFAEHYARTGIQYQKFNTAYQLAALQKEHPEQLEAAQTFLMIPDYLNYRLTGQAANEYTNATTTALVGARSKTWDDALMAKLGLPRRLFQPIRLPGETLGELLPAIRREVGFSCRVVLPATHDTGSAFLAVPAKDDNAVYLSSGTWSLLGVENKEPITTQESCAENFTNEGGAWYRYRYLKNIMGLWMIQSVRREIAEKTGARPSFAELIALAEVNRDFTACVNTDDPRFLAPDSMITAVREATGYKAQTPGQVMQTIYRSLSADYAKAIASLEKLTGKHYTSINIVGGGSQDGYLNRMTAAAAGLPVYAGPTEGTALGNLIVQFIAAGLFENLQAARDAIKDSFAIKEVLPNEETAG